MSKDKKNIIDGIVPNNHSLLSKTPSGEVVYSMPSDIDKTPDGETIDQTTAIKLRPLGSLYQNIDEIRPSDLGDLYVNNSVIKTPNKR